MKTIIASLVALGSIFVVSVTRDGTASAESPARCILYAREYAIAAVVPAPPGSTPAHSRQSIQDAAYARCLSLGVAAIVPPGTALAGKPLETAPKIVVKAPVRAKPAVRIAHVTAFVEDEPRIPAGRPSLAIAEIFGGKGSTRSLMAPIAPSCSGIVRTRFWRGLMPPRSISGC